MNILVVNAGSSSLKANLFSHDTKGLKELLHFHVDAIGHADCKLMYKGFGKNMEQKEKVKDHEQAIKLLFKWLDPKEVKAIGHRVVHGGEKYQQAIKIDAKVLKEIEKLNKIAPLHNPINLKCIQVCQKILPKVKQVAVFDTAFHQTMPPEAYLYGLPMDLYKKEQIRRYGFHGTSHKYVINEALKKLGKAKAKKAKIISCHLGNGSSITASWNGKSVDTSMGFTPLEGVMMGTRSGSIDPAVVLKLAKEHGIPKTEKLLQKESGLLGFSEISSDMREIHEASLKKDLQASLTIETLSYQIAKYCGSYVAALNGLDALVFTGGIGENAFYLRDQICDHLTFLGLKIDKSSNKENSPEISTKDSKIKVFIIKTEEELQIAKETIEVLS